MVWWCALAHICISWWRRLEGHLYARAPTHAHAIYTVITEHTHTLPRQWYFVVWWRTRAFYDIFNLFGRHDVSDSVGGGRWEGRLFFKHSDDHVIRMVYYKQLMTLYSCGRWWWWCWKKKMYDVKPSHLRYNGAVSYIICYGEMYEETYCGVKNYAFEKNEISAVYADMSPAWAHSAHARRNMTNASREWKRKRGGAYLRWS